MTIENLLSDFYKKNGIPRQGGIHEDRFQIKAFGINLRLPNPKLRKKVIHLHDIEHILNNCDTSWKGEAFIAGCELATGIWKHFPICLFTYWTVGYSLWIHPKAVFQGFKKGRNHKGVFDLKINKNTLMKMKFEDVSTIIQKEQKTQMGVLQWVYFLLWMLISEIFFLFPFLLLLFGVWSVIK